MGKSLKIDETETVSYPDDNLVLSSPVKFVGTFVNSGNSIILNGKVSTNVNLDCARCLKEFDSPFELDIDEEYTLDQEKVWVNNERELKEEDFCFQIGADKTINLSEIIRQNMIASLPIKPLCSVNCTASI
ncbi:hypothetical protein A3J90_05730 [candidate division WOR-1 bacterium RIFOXYC2_FULL_37_10]|uniref:DUF177 domain-containing protein n=1 Tax=candidate division WOR-1 bacterium RIFOXYB2_FULL_37_13 TaxID=1802579 RepID=A0A1F4SN28_UNCSA|nr:MAG: hypothetical protein A2246_04795 [candidate division WOR-1 bacterium RIFOXYA2_FULL_37_7]OGC21862.1 MAG: hypothetical protein A2310_01095 [candidate division WOR-1 bacterium RIFOXYB2_FULL_37_13]OGC37149.1 MAG: hypothetical protein A3J90_05730 [candidate division WOR-1 bacterium RIFOXYC2_FULL_37_10]